MGVLVAHPNILEAVTKNFDVGLTAISQYLKNP